MTNNKSNETPISAQHQTQVTQEFDQNKIQQVAFLARLKLTDSEAIELSDQLAKVIAHFDEISQIDTHGIDPLITPTDIECVLRADHAEGKFTAEDMTRNAPDKLGNLFKVPPVV